MATRVSDSSQLLGDIATLLLTEREVIPRARLIAAKIAELLPGAAVVIYAIDDQQNPRMDPKAFLGEVHFTHSQVAFDEGTLGEVAESREPFLCDPEALTREDYAHLDVRRTVTSLAYVPLIADEVLVGAIEMMAFDQPFRRRILGSGSGTGGHALSPLRRRRATRMSAMPICVPFPDSPNSTT